VDLSGGCSDRGNPSHVAAFRPKPGRFPPPKINVCESICAPVCVCVCVSRFCKTNLSSMCRFSAIEPGFDHSATVNNAREATAHLQHRMLACVCVCARVCVTGWSFFLLANVTGQFFDVPPLGPLNLVSDTGTPTLILSLRVCAPHVRVQVCTLEASTVDGEELNSSRQLRPAL